MKGPGNILSTEETTSMFGEIIRCWVVKSLLAGSFVCGSVSFAWADHCVPCHYKPVVCYEAREVPYTVCVTRYDHCGRPYHVEVTRYRTVTVRVTKLVKVCYQ
jgi:hypothetical protein